MKYKTYTDPKIEQTNCENFDDGLTQVAPKGEFKAKDWKPLSLSGKDMLAKRDNCCEKSWKLEDEREKWVSKWLQKRLTGRAIIELKMQDKEFLRRCENEAEFDTCLNKFVIDLDKLKGLAGKSLVEKEAEE